MSDWEIVAASDEGAARCIVLERIVEGQRASVSCAGAQVEVGQVRVSFGTVEDAAWYATALVIGLLTGCAEYEEDQ